MINDKPKKYRAPLSEKPESDLLWAIKHRHDDMVACRMELRSRGWTDEHIKERISK